MPAKQHEKILDKIKKCFALAGSSNPNEAETALRQARKLMDAHNLEIGDIQASTVGEARFNSGKRPPTWVLRLGRACAKAFDCEMITSQTYVGKELVFIGVDNAPEFSQYAYDVLSRQLVAARKDYVDTLTRCNLSTKRRRGTIFANSWVYSVHALITHFADADEKTTGAIAVYMEKKYPSLITTQLVSKKITKRDREAAWAGHCAGESATLHKSMGRNSQTALTRG